jgi:hypothetical protein
LVWGLHLKLLFQIGFGINFFSSNNNKKINSKTKTKKLVLELIVTEFGLLAIFLHQVKLGILYKGIEPLCFWCGKNVNICEPEVGTKRERDISKGTKFSSKLGWRNFLQPSL